MDVSNELLPLPLGTEATTGDARDVVFIDGYAIVADDGAGRRVVNVDDPLDPFTETVLSLTRAPVALTVSGDELYDDRGVPVVSGVYFLRLDAAARRVVRKVTRIR